MTDDGLMFFATICKADGASMLNRETPNRQEFLDWIDAHYRAGDDLTITLEARGPAVANMLLALRIGALRMHAAGSS